MKHLKKITAAASAIAILFLISCSPVEQANSEKTLSGPYLGQTPPGKEAMLFAPGVISTYLDELYLVFFPDAKELIVSVNYGTRRWALVGMKEVDGEWTNPEVLPFSGQYSDVDAFISSDGNRIWFASNRPEVGETEAKDNFDLWYVDRTEDGWGEPVNPGAPINSDTSEFFPCLVADGSLYFQSRREGGPGMADIFYSKYENGEYLEPVALPAPINNEGFQGDTLISPDESYAIVSTTPEGKTGWSDLFICFKDENGDWGELINMGSSVNSDHSENTPSISPDGKYLIFKSGRSINKPLLNTPITYSEIQKLLTEPQQGSTDIYWISTEIIDDLKLLSLNNTK